MSFSDMPGPFDFPEVVEVLRELLDKVLGESGRGALLIATELIDDQLAKLIKTILPDSYSKKQIDRLLNYPGPLSSLSAKIELTYAFRIIDQNLYESLNALRSVRNHAAHSSSEFVLHELNEKMKAIYNVGPSMIDHIKEGAMKMMIEAKISAAAEALKEAEMSGEEKYRFVTEYFFSEKGEKMVKEQTPFWELIHGVCFLVSLICFHKQRLSEITTGKSTWSMMTLNTRDIDAA